MSAIATASAVGERRRRTRRGGPRCGGRSAARRPPRRAGPARAGGPRRSSRGSRSGGGRSRRRRPRRPPRPCARAGGRRRRTTPGRPRWRPRPRPARAPPPRRRGRWPRCGGRRSRSRTASGPRAGPARGSRSSSCPDRVATIRPRSARAGPPAVANCSAIPRPKPAARAASASTIALRSSRPVAVRPAEPGGARVADVDHDDGRPSAPVTPAQPAVGERRRVDGAPRSAKDVGMVPLGASQDGDRRPVRRRSCRRTRRPPRRTTAPGAAARGGRRAARQRRRQEGADERRRVAAGGREDVDEPARGRALAVGPGHADERSPDGRVGDHLLPRLDRASPPARAACELGVVGLDRGERLGDREAVRAGRRRSRGGVVLPGERRSRPRRAPACRATARRRRSRRRRRRPAARRRTAALAPAPAAPTTWIRSPAGIGRAARAGGRPVPGVATRSPGSASRRPGRGASAGRARRRSRRSSGGDGAVARLFAARSPGQTMRRTSTPVGVRDREIGEADGLLGGPTVRAGDPGDRCRDVACRVDPGRRPPSPARPGRSPRRGPRGSPSSRRAGRAWPRSNRRRRRRGSSRSSPATSVRAAATNPPVHDSAMATVAPAPDAGRLQPGRAASPSGSPPPPIVSCAGSSSGAARRLNSQVSGTPRLPSAPSDCAVQGEQRDARRSRPDLDRGLAREGQDLAVADTLPGAPDRRIELAVHPDLDPGRAALDVTTRLTPL